MADKKKQKMTDGGEGGEGGEGRDIFETALDNEKLFSTAGALAGGILGARLTGGKFGKKNRVFRDADLNFGARVLGGGLGAIVGGVGGEVARQNMGGMPAGKKRRK
jgi:hypothetical protein